MTLKYCGWCSDDDFHGDIPPCNCKKFCGKDACLKGPYDMVTTGEIIVKSTGYATSSGGECKWCHTTKPCPKGKLECECISDCNIRHCLLGPLKGDYPLNKGSNGWDKYKKGNSSSGNSNGVIVAGSGYGGSYGYNTTSFQCSKNSHPDELFSWQGIKFSGFPKHKLEDRIGKAGDPKRLIVNCSNSSFSPHFKPGIPEAPKLVDKATTDALKTLESPDLAWKFSEILPYYTDELSLNWSDGKALPADLIWWEKFLEIIVAEGYQEIDVCCVGGHGRTGTFLGVILMLTHEWKKEPSVEAEAWINKHYCAKAIETKDQQDYLDWIAKRMSEPKDEVVVITSA